jgi:predicted nucleotide-binding protein
MARRSSSPQPRPADWSPKKTYAALKTQLVALEVLRGQNYSNAENKEQGWTNLTFNILTHGFGENSNNVRQFRQAGSAGSYFVGEMSEALIQENFVKRIEAFDAVLTSTLTELELMGAEPAANEGAVTVKSDSRNVFLVHGHNDGATASVARFLEKLSLHPIILHEQPNMGRTVIEKFEAHADVGFAVVLLTPDDLGGLAASPEALKPRARQNVILELGYFIGRLGRARVCALYIDGVEIPSDIHGVLYVPYDGENSWRIKLASEIRAVGIAVDLNLA